MIRQTFFYSARADSSITVLPAPHLSLFHLPPHLPQFTMEGDPLLTDPSEESGYLIMHLFLQSLSSQFLLEVRTFPMTFIESEAPHSVQTYPAFAPQTAGTGSSCHPSHYPRTHTHPVPKSSRSANRKMNPNKTFSGKLLSNYTACCGTHCALPPASCHQHLCYCARGRVASMSGLSWSPPSFLR